MMEALADAAGLSPPPFDTGDAVPVPARLDSLSDELQSLASCGVDLANIEPLQDEMKKLQSWMWNGPLLPCHYRLSDLLSKQDDSHPATTSARSTLLDVGCGVGGKAGEKQEQEVLMGVLAEIREVSTKLQSGVDFST